jgi:hypothetical protein
MCRNPSLGLTTKAKRVARLQAKRKPGSHITYSRECKKVWGSEPSHSQSNSHFVRWSPGGLPKLQRAIWGVKTQWLVTFFISLEKILELRCLKWVRIAHLDIWNTSYGQKKGRESNYQFDSRTKKLGIDPIYLSADNLRHTIGKILTRATTLLQTTPRSKVYSQSYGAPKSRSKVYSQSYGAPKSRSKVYSQSYGAPKSRKS